MPEHCLQIAALKAVIQLTTNLVGRCGLQGLFACGNKVRSGPVKTIPAEVILVEARNLINKNAPTFLLRVNIRIVWSFYATV